MNPELTNMLQSCIDYCEQLDQKTQNDNDLVRNCLGGELMNSFLEANTKSASGIKKIREQLLSLQAESMI